MGIPQRSVPGPSPAKVGNQRLRLVLAHGASAREEHNPFAAACSPCLTMLWACLKGLILIFSFLGNGEVACRPLRRAVCRMRDPIAGCILRRHSETRGPPLGHHAPISFGTSPPPSGRNVLTGWTFGVQHRAGWGCRAVSEVVPSPIGMRVALESDHKVSWALEAKRAALGATESHQNTGSRGPRQKDSSEPPPPPKDPGPRRRPPG